MFLIRLVCPVFLAPLCAAQGLIIVDAQGGAGSHFRTIPPAIAAAQPGDTVLVRAGLYTNALVIDKGIRLIGEDAQLAGQFSLDGAVLVRNVPAGQTFGMRGFRAQPDGFPPVIHVRDCAGAVTLRDLRQSNLNQFGVNIRTSRQVHVADMVLRSASTTATSAVFERVVFDPGALAGLLIDGGSVDCALCSLRGSFNTFGGAGVHLVAGRVRLTRSTVQGTAAGGMPFAAIDTIAGEVHLDPTTTLQPAAGAPPISGPATVVRRDLTHLSTGTDGSTLTTDLQGPAGAAFVTLASVPSPALATPFGDLWLSTVEQVIFDFGTLDATRQHRWSFTYPPVVPHGFTLTMQTVVYTSTFELSMPSLLTFP
jgi:hypothetical protein